jgi:hypothetical protein
VIAVVHPAFVGQMCITRGMAYAPAGPASAMLTSEVLFSFIFQATLSESTVHAHSAIGATLIMLSVTTMMIAQKRSAAPAVLPLAGKRRLGSRGSSEESCAFNEADSAAITHGQEVQSYIQEAELQRPRESFFEHPKPDQ